MKNKIFLSIFVFLSLFAVACGNDPPPHISGWIYPADLSDNISPDGVNASDAQVAMDDNGNAIIVWGQSVAGITQIFKSEYRDGVWTYPSSLADNISPNGPSSSPKVAMDNNGNAIIVWQQNDGFNYQIFKSEYRDGKWTHPSDPNDNFSPDGTEANTPQVAMDNNGNAIITWQQSDGSRDQIFKSEYRHGHWTHPSSTSDNISPDAQAADFSHVAMDDDGNAIIVWRQSDGSNTQIFKSEYRHGVRTNPSDVTDNISSDGTDVQGEPQVAMDNNGNAIIVWQQSDGSDQQIFKSEYRHGVWTNPSDLTNNISPDGQSSNSPQVAMDNDGNAIIVWDESDGIYEQIFKSEYRNGKWKHPTSLSNNISPNGRAAYSPQAAMDNNDNAIIIWQQSDGNNQQVFKSEYRNGKWTHPSSTSDNISSNETDVSVSLVAMDNNSNAIIVWDQSDGLNEQIFKAEYR